MRKQRHVRYHLLVDELIPLGDLDDAIEHQDAPMRLALEDQDVLKVTLHLCQFASDAETLDRCLSCAMTT